jgi:aminopeptidase YwaD
MKKLLIVLAFIPTVLFSQSRKERKALEARQKADQIIINNLKNHVQGLTGVKAGGSAGVTEAHTIEYISNQFKSAGLQPKGSNAFIQSFKVDNGKAISPSTFLQVKDKALELHKEYFPLPYSAEKKVSGMPAMALRERGVPWFIDLKDFAEGDSKATGNRNEDVLKKEISKLAAKGATAVFIYNTATTIDGLVYNKTDKSAPLPIPVIYITPEGLKKHFNDQSEVLDIELNVAFRESTISGSNIIGYLDNAAPSTIVIGAHYNRVDPVSDEKENIAKISAPGADDNVSGIALLIELAKMLSASKAKTNNYAFIALGGSDKNSTASKYWLENPGITSPVNYMVNVDMVGSYDEAKKLKIQGVSTSPAWKDILPLIADKKLAVNVDSASTVDYPYAAFYEKGIPELSFSSSSHRDYAATPDDEGKINYAGILQVANLITRLVEATDGKGKLAFSKISSTRPATTPTATAPANSAVKTAGIVANTTVSLGVIPDKSLNEFGLKISGVSPRKLASRLGLQAGDVLTNLGSFQISDLTSYMQALSNFKSGDKTTLRIKRGKDNKEFAVVF